MPCALLETLFPTQKDTYPISRGAMVEAKKKKKKKEEEEEEEEEVKDWDKIDSH
jgi:hypothetical protein